MTKLKQSRLLFVVSLIILLCVPSLVSASSATVVKLWIGNPAMSVNGTETSIDAQGTKPVIVEGRTLVPIRAVIEAFDGTVSWDATTRKVTINLARNTLDLWIGKSQASLNGQTRSIDPANSRVLPVIMSGRTMLPLRFVGESLGIDVQYDAITKMITLTYTPAVTPPSSESGTLTLQQGWSFRQDSMGGYVVGRVVNTSSQTVEFATVTFALLDRNGKTVDKGIDMTADLAPGATWLFKVANFNTDVVKAEFISVTYSGLKTPSAETNPLRLQPDWSFEQDSMGGYVVGRVVNTSSQTVEFATVTFALLDRNGKTVDKGIDMTADLAPGATWLFKVANFNTDVVKAEFISVGGH